MSMVLDIIILLILAFFITIGFRKGFFYTFVRALGWIVAIILGFILHTPFSSFLKDNTGIYDSIYSNVMQEITERVDFSSSANFFTSLIEETLAETATNISTAVFNIFTFLVLVAFIKLVLFLLTLLISGRDTGIIGGFNKLFGMLMGLVVGIIFVFILLAVLMPFCLMIGPDTYFKMLGWIDDSYFTWMLYDYNPILYLIDGFIPEFPDTSDFDFNTETGLPEGIDTEDIPEDVLEQYSELYEDQQ